MIFEKSENKLKFFKISIDSILIVWYNRKVREKWI